MNKYFHDGFGVKYDTALQIKSEILALIVKNQISTVIEPDSIKRMFLFSGLIEILAEHLKNSSYNPSDVHYAYFTVGLMIGSPDTFVLNTVDKFYEHVSSDTSVSDLSLFIKEYLIYQIGKGIYPAN